MDELRKRDAVAARALEFVILTATRTSEALLATWDELDLEAEVWTIPAVENEGPRRAPRAALEPGDGRFCATWSATRGDGDNYVFIGQREGRPLSNMALLMMLRRMKRGDLTAHGFRSTFSDWASEVSSFSGELRETALAHTISEQGRARLSSWRCAGKAPGNDGGLGNLVQPCKESTMKRPSTPGALKQIRDYRLNKGLRAGRKSMVHLVTPRGKKQPFTDEKREELLSVLIRIKPNPSSEQLDKMIAVAERVVNDLIEARKEQEEF